MHVDLEPLERAGLPPASGRSAPTPGPSCARPSAASRRASWTRPAPMPANRSNDTDRADWETATATDDEDWSGPGAHPAHVVATARRILPDDATVTTDAGNFGLWVCPSLPVPAARARPRADPGGDGLCPACRDRRRRRPSGSEVVAFAGDGGFAMTMAELETAVREKVKVIAVVFDNERYGTIRMHQDGRAGEDAAIATDLGPIDFAGDRPGLRRTRDPGRVRRGVRAGPPPGDGQRSDDRHPGDARSRRIHPDQPFAGAPSTPPA